jgi:sterol desaturase/sphingolipid hydroxylase (fatty acid hydroxylase superfamily)
MNGVPAELKASLTGDLKAVFDTVYYLAFNFTKAVLAFLQRDSYLYWPFIVSTLAIMAFVAFRAAARSEDGRSWRQQFGGYFSSKVWWHASARADYRLYFANALILPLIFGWFALTDSGVFGALDSLLGRVPAGTGSPSIAGRIAYTILFFVAYDFGRFVAHSLLHDVPALWEFHKVHHSAEVLTPITSYRAHPIDLLIMGWVPALTTGLATWAFNRISDGPISFYAFLGLHVALWAINLVDNLRHSHVWLTYGPVVGRWIVSPAHHQLHHSCEPRHWAGNRGGCNRGFSLAIWDRLYGTLRMPEAQPEQFRMGLGDGTDAGWHNVRRMYWWPLAGFMRSVFGRWRRSAPQ